MTWTPESLSSLATEYWRSQTLLTGIETGLLEHLPATADTASHHASINPRIGTMLLEALTAMGITTAEGGTFDLTPSARPYLLLKSPTSLVGALRFNASMYSLWSKLPDVARTGAPALPAAAHLGQDPTRTRGFVLAMHSRGLALLPPVAAAIDLSAATKVLDIGSGAGTLSRLLAEKNPQARFTCIDLPAITQVAVELTASHPNGKQITHLAADYLSAPLPNHFDVVLYSGALHQHSKDQAPALLQKLASSLRPGGHLYLIDFLTNPSRTSPEFPLLFALNMALVSPHAHTHSLAEAEAESYLTAANLSVPEDLSPGESLYQVLRSAKQ